MGAMKARRMWSMWVAKVRVEPSRATDLSDGPRGHLRCPDCDWGRDEVPATVKLETCPRCGARLIGDGT